MSKVPEFDVWGDRVAGFLAETLPMHPDEDGWDDKAMTAYQVGCMALAALGHATRTPWGAQRREPPERPTVLPRWDDICVSMLWLAEQHNLISYRLADGQVPRPAAPRGMFVIRQDVAPAPPPSIPGRLSLGPARCDEEVLHVLQTLGLVRDGRWTTAAEPVLWRTSPEPWELDIAKEARFVEAAQLAVKTVPDDIARSISELAVITDAEVDENIQQHEVMIAQAREKYGPKARLGHVPSAEQSRRALEFRRKSDLDWVFFRRWRLEDGWLADAQAHAALEIFHDRLAILMRKAVMEKLHPQVSWSFE